MGFISMHHAKRFLPHEILVVREKMRHGPILELHQDTDSSIEHAPPSKLIENRLSKNINQLAPIYLPLVSKVRDRATIYRSITTTTYHQSDTFSMGPSILSPFRP